MSVNPNPAESLYGGVFIQLTEGSEQENRQLAEELFTGNLLEWAARRNRALGDYIIPKVVYLETVENQPHKVAWVEHVRTSVDTDETIHNHHVVCECVLCKNFNDGKGGINTGLCEVMTHALEARAEAVGTEFLPVIAASQDFGALNILTGSSEVASQFDIESMSLSALEHVLRSDNSHPEAWHGNPVSGSLPVEQAGRIIDQSLDLTVQYAELLHKSGKIDFDGEELRLAA